jgi:hypothetical protein
MKRGVEIGLISKPTTDTIIPCIQAIRANTVIGGLREAKEFVDDLAAGKKEMLDLTDQQIVALQATKYFCLSYSGVLDKKALRKKRAPRKPKPKSDIRIALNEVHDRIHDILHSRGKLDYEKLRIACLALTAEVRKLQKEAK